VEQLPTNHKLISTEEVRRYQVDPNRKFFSANHEEIERGLTTDIYFIRALEILRFLKLDATEVTAEIFARQAGVFAGMQETYNLLKDKKIKLWSLSEGDLFQPKETVMRIQGPYNEFGVYETIILGILGSSSAWATAARECREVARGKKNYLFWFTAYSSGSCPCYGEGSAYWWYRWSQLYSGSQVNGTGTAGNYSSYCYYHNR